MCMFDQSTLQSPLQRHVCAGFCAGACTLFATHFTRLAELAAVYPSCKLWHFGVNASAQSEQLDYTWKLVPGQQQAVHYGLILANSVGIPQQVSKAATNSTGQACTLCPVLWCSSRHYDTCSQLQRGNLNNCPCLKLNLLETCTHGLLEGKADNRLLPIREW